MTDSIPKKPLKKGSLVFVDRENYIKSIEALASDHDLPNYVFEGPGEILSVKDALSEFDRYTQGYVDNYLFDGKEMIKEAKSIQSKMSTEKKNKNF